VEEASFIKYIQVIIFL